jgi:hypothetical protein
MLDKCLVVLQNSVDLLKAVPGSDTEMYYTGNEVIDIKAEDVTDIQEDEHPVLIACPVIKTEQVVRLYIHRHITQIPYTNCLLSFSSQSDYPATSSSCLW